MEDSPLTVTGILLEDIPARMSFTSMSILFGVPFTNSSDLSKIVCPPAIKVKSPAILSPE